MYGRKTHQLLQVPAADLHVAALLVHAAGELLGRVLAVVAPAVVLLLALRRDGHLLLLLLLNGGRGGAAAEEAADGVADRGADRDTTVVEPAMSATYILARMRPSSRAGPPNMDSRGASWIRDAYAAVVAIWAKRPGPCEAAGAGAAGAACCCVGGA